VDSRVAIAFSCDFCYNFVSKQLKTDSMKRNLLLAMMLTIALICGAQTPWNGTVADAYNGGDGTPENPYQIATAEQLALLAQQTNSGTGGNVNYMLTNDIVLNDGDSLLWTPIGNICPFTGVFDGNDHVISGLYENGNKNSGLFASTENATIQNTILENATVLEYEQAFVYTAIGGILIGQAKNTNIWDCSVDGLIEIFSAKPSGGLVGQCQVDVNVNDTVFIKNCVNNATVIENECTGGIAGKTIVNNGNLVIDNCANHGSINGWTFAGGMVGDGDFIIKNCDNYGEIVSEGTAGGLAGQGGQSCLITNCFNHESGKITGGMNTGGIIGTAITTVMSCCGNAALLTGINEDEIMIGGISGADGTIYNCFNRGDLKAVFTSGNPLLVQMGGITSTPINDEYVKNVYNAGAVIRPSNTNIQSKWFGYIVPAIINDTMIKNCYWTGEETLITEHVYNLTTNHWILLPNSTRFHQGATATSWLLKAQQYGTYDLIEALNAGAMGQCVWEEDVEGVNGGFPIPRPFHYMDVQEQYEAELVVYPNPTNDILTVETVCTPSPRGQTEYRITNLLGQTLQMGSFIAENQQIDVSSFPGGIYFITVGSTTTKFIKR
jgi:hypothetical protein